MYKEEKKTETDGGYFFGVFISHRSFNPSLSYNQQFYYKSLSGEAIDDFTQGKAALNKEEIEERLGLARAYNDSLIDSTGAEISDPYSEEEKAAGRAEYARMLEINERWVILESLK